jgi:hypothetical protein
MGALLCTSALPECTKHEIPIEHLYRAVHRNSAFSTDTGFHKNDFVLSFISRVSDPTEQFQQTKRLQALFFRCCKRKGKDPGEKVDFKRLLAALCVYAQAELDAKVQNAAHGRQADLLSPKRAPAGPLTARVLCNCGCRCASCSGCSRASATTSRCA